jgi:hypothetical protein
MSTAGLKLGLDLGRRSAGTTPRGTGASAALSSPKHSGRTRSGGQLSARQQSSSGAPQAVAVTAKPRNPSDDEDDEDDEDDDDEDDFECDDDDEFDDMDSDVAHDPNAQWMYHVWVWMGSAYSMEAAFEGDTRLFADTCAHELGTLLHVDQTMS